MNIKRVFLKIGAIYLAACMAAPVAADQIVIFGASGQFGSQLVREALDRGHQVIGVSRTPEKFQYTEENFTPLKGNPTEIESVKEIISSADAIVVALGDRQATTPETSAMNLAAIALTTVLHAQGADGPPVIVLGGGNTAAADKNGMLQILESRAVDGQVDPRLEQIFLSQWATYQTYKASNINWTYVATPTNILGLRGGSPDG